MSGYIGTQPVPQATQHREAFTATASQTSFATVGYTPQFVDVYLNGVKLAAADYTATNGSDIVLTTGAALNDILEYVAYTPFEVASQTFTGTTTVTDSGAAPLVANRTTSDGTIIDLRKDGTTVGSIGATNGDMFLATGVAGIRLTDSVPDIRPVLSDGSNSDATTNLGAGGDRFKDLYLSGGVYLGGTGAANYLDDYEEGTVTATMVPATSGTITLGPSNILAYTKVGRVVHVQGMLQPTSVSSPVGASVAVTLPFTALGAGAAGQSERIGGSIAVASIGVASTPYRTFGGDTTLSIQIDASIITAGFQFYIAFSYIAA